MKDAPTLERANAFFRYDHETGHFHRKYRPRSEFNTKTGYTRNLRKIDEIAGSKEVGGYWRVQIDEVPYLAHKVAWLIMTGEWVEYPAFEIDHINGVKDDNRWANLRKVTKSQNQRNAGQRINNTSGVHGVNWKPKPTASDPSSGRWVARIWNGPRHVYLGQFKTLGEAAIARNAAERVLGFTGTDRPANKVAAE